MNRKRLGQLGTAAAVAIALAAMPALATDLCAAYLDKRVLCNNEGGFVDFGRDPERPPNGPVCQTCTARNGQPVLVQYEVANDGFNTTLKNCRVEDNGSTIGDWGRAGIGIISADRKAPGDPLEWVRPVQSSEFLCPAQPPAVNGGVTATLTCDCFSATTGALLQTITVTTGDVPQTDDPAADCAGFECRDAGTPAVKIEKVCEPQADGTNVTHYVVTNVGTTELNNCVVVDRINRLDPLCPADNPDEKIGEEPLVDNSLAPGESEDSRTVAGGGFVIEGLTADACNRVTVECVGPAPDFTVVTAYSDDLCEAPEPACDCLIVIDEDSIDNDIKSIEAAAYFHGVLPDFLVNDDRPTEIGNPYFRWNELFPGDVVRIPTGQVKDEGWFALPPNTPWTIQDFVDGVVPQDRLDKIDGVMPIRDRDIVRLVGKTCTAIVYDSDISINYKPINGNLQGARYGRFRFTILNAFHPGTLPESGSSQSLYDVRIRVEDDSNRCLERFNVPRNDEDPDTVQTLSASYNNMTKKVTVWATSSLQPHAGLNITIAGKTVDAPFVFEAPMTWNAQKKRFEFTATSLQSLKNRRLHISSSKGGSYTDFVK